MEKPPEERAAYTHQAAQSDDALAAEVQRMIDAHLRSVSFLDGSVTAPFAMRTDPRRMEGRRLGAYEVLVEIGRGGMGTVFLARRADGVFDQQVAIKVINPESAGGEILRRFEQEREILASLDHPNIARLYDGGSTEEGWPYFVMEYVAGQPIDEYCEQRKLNVSERIRLFDSVCAAVYYAHQHHVIHRDLKPGNILVAAGGSVKLLDFGIAKVVRVKADQRTALVTRTGMRMMTPEYASPEQIRAEEASPLADLYSLGVILYELLTGRRPYRLKSRVFHEVVRVVCEEPPTLPSLAVTETDVRPTDDGKSITVQPGRLSQSREGTPSDLKRRLAGDLDSILVKTLEKDPRRRYRSVEQFQKDLERHLNGQPIVADRSGRLAAIARAAGRYRLPIAVGLALLLALLIGGIRVDWRGLGLIAGAVLLIALWHAATDLKVGAKISESIYGQAAVLVGAISVLSMMRSLLGKWEGDAKASAAVLAGGLIAIGYAGVMLIAFWFRERWTGSLLARFRTSSERRKYVSIAVSASWFAPAFWRKGDDYISSRLDLWADAAVWVFIGLMLTWIWLVVPVLEVRDRGILHCGRLISWLNIERYEWEPAPQLSGGFLSLAIEAKPDVLRLHVTRRFTFLQPVRIRIEGGKEELEAILIRHLSAWPG